MMKKIPKMWSFFMPDINLSLFFIINKGTASDKNVKNVLMGV